MFIGWRLFVLSILFFVPFFAWSITRIVKSNHFDDNCTYHVQEALTNSSTIEPKNLSYSDKQISLAIDYIEINHLNAGWTTISGRTSSEDLALFHENLIKKRDYIHKLQELDSQQLTGFQDYVNFRGLKPTSFEAPEGISIYPNNTLYLVWMYISILSAILGIIGMIVFINQRSSIGS